MEVYIQALQLYSLEDRLCESLMRTSVAPSFIPSSETNAFLDDKKAKAYSLFASATHLTTNLPFILYVVMNAIVYAKAEN